MTLTSTTPAFNLKVVVQETGIKPDTLRAWERRYNLPQPGRTSGGHRLYSQYDIEIIKWLMARQEEGLSISRAVKLWQTLAEEGKDPLEEMAYEEEEPQFEAFNMPDVASGKALQEMRQAWIKACFQFDEAAADRILTQAFALYPPEMVCLEVLQKGIARIGELWYQNKATVQQEHFASALAMRRLNALLAATPAPTRTARLLIACPPDETHTFAPLLLTLMLRYRGWEVIYLGANVPIDRMENTVSQVNPHLVILTAQLLNTAANLLHTARLLDKQEVTVAFGGLIFNSLPVLRRRVPGHFLGETLADAVQTVEHVLLFKPSSPKLEPVPEKYRDARHAFREKQAMIENDVWQSLKSSSIQYEHLANANVHLAHNITAALQLGDLSFLQNEIDWIMDLLANYEEPLSLLQDYIEAYTKAAEAHLDASGQPIKEGLSRLQVEADRKRP